AELAIRPGPSAARKTGSHADPVLPATAALGCRGREFSPVEQSIMKVVMATWQTKTEIADKCGMSLSSSFCAVLTNLVHRDYRESSGRGYRLLPAPAD